MKKKELDIEHILKFAPARNEVTLSGLADYIHHSAWTETGRARITYAWVAKNIVYDVAKYYSGKKAGDSAEEAYKSGVATCNGFAGLFAALLKRMAIECVSIPGCAKGYGYDPEMRERDNNHDWNAVKLEGEWQLVDVTWGAGVITGKTFAREYEEFYFCTDPEIFVRSHFPNDPKWQLIDPPMSREHFERLPKYKPLFYKSGLTGSWPEFSVIECSEPTLIFKVMCGSNIVRLQAALKKITQDAYEEIPAAAFVQRADKCYEIEVQVPEDGNYNVVIYSPKSPSDKALCDILTYRVKAKGIKKGTATKYPEEFICFTEHSGFLFYPTNAVLTLGETAHFKLRAKEAEEVDVIVGENWCPLEKSKEEEDVYFGNVEIEDRKVGVYAKKPGAKNFEALLTYQVEGVEGKKKEKKQESEAVDTTKPLKKDLATIKACGLANFPKEGTLLVKGNKARLELDTAPGCELLATLSTSKDEEIESSTLVQNVGEHFFIDVAFPDNGNYGLAIFAKHKSKEGGLPFAMKYSVVVEGGAKTQQTMPELYAGFKEAEGFVYEPLTGTLKAGSSVSFKVKANKVAKMSVFMGEVEVPLVEKAGSTFVSAHPIQMPKGGVLGVFGNFEGEDSKSMRCLVEYKVKQ